MSIISWFDRLFRISHDIDTITRYVLKHFRVIGPQVVFHRRRRVSTPRPSVLAHARRRRGARTVDAFTIVRFDARAVVRTRRARRTSRQRSRACARTIPRFPVLPRALLAPWTRAIRRGRAVNRRRIVRSLISDRSHAIERSRHRSLRRRENLRANRDSPSCARLVRCRSLCRRRRRAPRLMRCRYDRRKIKVRFGFGVSRAREPNEASRAREPWKRSSKERAVTDKGRKLKPSLFGEAC